MKIYADTSFLVSLLYQPDLAHGAASAFFLSQPEAEWVTSDWLQFETANSLRQLCLKPGGPGTAMMEGVRRLLKRWHERGNFVRAEVELSEALIECQQLSTAFGNSMRMRSADVLHVALLEQINPDLFVTRDTEQFKLAHQRAFPSKLIP
jgi:predicted nucleic acid-binding protein